MGRGTVLDTIAYWSAFTTIDVSESNVFVDESVEDSEGEEGDLRIDEGREGVPSGPRRARLAQKHGHGKLGAEVGVCIDVVWVKENGCNYQSAVRSMSHCERLYL